VQEDKVGAELSSLKDSLEKNKAIIISEEAPKLRPLAYEMRKETAGKYQKYNSAYFGWFKFEATSEAIKAIEESFKKTASVLRYLLIKTVRENTMTAPKIPSYRRAEAPKFEEKKEAEQGEKKVVSETELDKAIDAAIAE
jgi:ribosomal protein S6